MHKLRPLLRYFRPYRTAILLGIGSIALTSFFSLLSPQIIGRAIDSLRVELNPDTVLRYALLLLGITAVQGIFLFVQRRLLVGMSRDIERDLRDDFFAQLTRMQQGFFHDHATGDLMARATNDIGAVRMLCGPAIMYAASTLFTAAGALFLMLSLNPWLTLLALSPAPLVALTTKVFGRRIHDLFEGVQGEYSKVSTKVQENLMGLRVLRAFAQEEAEERSFDRLNTRYVGANERLIRWQSAFHPSIQLLVGLGFAAVIGYGGLLILDGALTVGQFVTFQLFLGRLVWPMVAIGWVINIAQRAAASMGRLQQILDEQPAIADAPADRLAELPAVHGALRFRDLSFAFPGREPALRDIDLEIPAGKTVAIVGRTGAGKSTLLSLLPRLIEPPARTLSLDGVDVLRLRLRDLRRAMAMVPQETFLFSATLAENIALGRPGASQDEILRAAHLAGLDHDLELLPQGLETLVGERGITLSGGQKQRVALARALLRDPQILLLDDCLSAVDAQTEERILGNLRDFFPGRTVLLASHRIAAASLCDEVVVLENGRVVDRGRHDDLIQREGLYATLYRRQRLEEQLAQV
jgi:ATP-binding cassette subfamily B multidrug efflux pump